MMTGAAMKHRINELLSIAYLDKERLGGEETPITTYTT